MSKTAFQIRQNAEELKAYLKDLESWESDIKRKDRAVNKETTGNNFIPPIRNQNARIIPETTITLEHQGAGMVRASSDTRTVLGEDRIKSQDYKAWDADKALDAVDAQRPELCSSKSAKVSADQKDFGERAILEKEKGNAWFKKGDYKRAILCYSKSMQLDPTSAVLPVNRALAYLKLDRFAEAEADCTQGIEMDPKNVKALWRRGIARAKLGKAEEARQDLEAAVVLEPTNKSIKADLSDVLTSIKEKATKNDRKNPTRPVRRRLAIEEVGEEAVGINRSLKAHQITSLQGNGTTMPIAAQEVSKRDVKVPVNSLSPPPAQIQKSQLVRNAAADISKPVVLPSVSASAAPKSMYEFERDWKSLKGDSAAIYGYLKIIDPKSYQRIFKNSLESSYISKIIFVLRDHYKKDNKANEALDTLKHLALLPRFDMNAMFLSKADKQALRDILDWLKACADDNKIDPSDIHRLQKAYKV
ncbi:uncharacterized protein SPPG_08567 [Spizellomyces punctatus DAOM BR117]|uniref:RNA polymerase II-associated protein 3 n=1 Tax=Spizellomyces punctatus (strain DAOM BR117) TaxID=645134 RepID=A0A0L0H433_SPIPD|nr:uncharacterized protein SPPG_08567 [Spizellomyces punctatus DAOM BR117]KNC95962.1 hypothetical protein SPPG_08567 [Spizellomyces punctatus DAOM BR117]|eukprot:XP_016604002.1 hypothetical protein SPPG_08567 [Spizellomyces punctatus DAOM BR117]